MAQRKTTLRQKTAIALDSGKRELTDAEIYRSNPHCGQWNKYPGGPLPRLKELVLDLNDVGVKFNYQKLPYYQQTILHWGQRKLFLSELDFLTRFSSEGDTILYVGAAPGTHLKLIAELFPSLKFILYDGNDFDADLYDNPNFEIRQMFFTDIEALRFTDVPNLLFISDIRGDVSDDREDIKQLRVSYDMKDQERWYDLISSGRSNYPKKALLKFRLPHPPEHLKDPGTYTPLPHDSYDFPYLDGELRIQAYPRQSSAEMRLIPNGKKRLWDVKLHDDKSTTHNFYRAAYYVHEEVEGLDHCFDCAYEIYLWKEYAKHIKKLGGKENTVQHYVNLLNKNLASGIFTPLTYRAKE